MTDKEVQKLKRVDLLELLIEQSKEVESLRDELKETKKQLEDKKICIEQAGSIAEASLLLNGVFDAAQSAAQQYLENIKYLSSNQEKICEEMMKKTQEKCEAMEKETEETCKKMLEEARIGAEKQWSEVSEKLQAFYDAHQGLREILAFVDEVPGLNRMGITID